MEADEYPRLAHQESVGFGGSACCITICSLHSTLLVLPGLALAVPISGVVLAASSRNCVVGFRHGKSSA